MQPDADEGDDEMQWKLLHEHHGQRTLALVLETGDEVMDTLRSFARERGLRASQFTAIGALKNAKLAFFDLPTMKYAPIPIDEQAEVLSLLGDITEEDGEPRVHAHAVLGLRDGTTRGGHLLEAHTRPTLEVLLTESPDLLERRHDPQTGLSLTPTRSS